MEIIDPDWIRRRLGTRHGAQTALAVAIGLTPDQMSKVMNGQRKLTPPEIAGVLRHFNYRLTPFDDMTPPGGMGEPGVAPFTPATPAVGRSLEAMAAALAPGWRYLTTYRAARAFPAYQIVAGDILVIGKPPAERQGDIVVATWPDPDSVTLLAQRAGQTAVEGLVHAVPFGKHLTAGRDDLRHSQNFARACDSALQLGNHSGPCRQIQRRPEPRVDRNRRLAVYHPEPAYDATGHRRLKRCLRRRLIAGRHALCRSIPGRRRGQCAGPLRTQPPNQRQEAEHCNDSQTDDHPPTSHGAPSSHLVAKPSAALTCHLLIRKTDPENCEFRDFSA